jgi:hypothetical protein
MFDEINNQLLTNYESTLKQWFPNGRKRGYDFCVGSLAGEAGASLKVHLTKGVWKDFSTGQGGSDPVSLFAAIRGLSQGDAAKELKRSGIGVSIAITQHPQEEEPEWTALRLLPDEDEMPRPKFRDDETAFEYRREDGQLYGYVVRRKLPNGKKAITPLSWCINNETGHTAWQRKGFPIPRPLYGLHLLKAFPDGRCVVVVEGEKCADKLTADLAGIAPVISWSGGSNAVNHTDWAPLDQFAQVVIWPDADDAGRKAAADIAGKFKGSARIVELPADVPKGWDCADCDKETALKLLGLFRDVVATTTTTTETLNLNTGVATRVVEVTQELEPVGSSMWERYGIRAGRNGQPLINMAAVWNVLSNHSRWAGRIWYDTFLERIITTAFSDVATEWTDNHEREVLLWLQGAMELGTASSVDVKSAIQLIASREKRNELSDWLQSLTWDNQARVDQVASTGFGVKQSDYASTVGRCWLISAVARALQPGCKVDTMPIFEGSQGAGKSTALNRLGGKWFSEIHNDIREKDFFASLKGKWILEISEMHAFSRAEVNRIKGIISCQVDRYRVPYETHSTDHPRQSVFAGTTNRDDWQTDPTGARRFWPLRCGKVNIDWIEANREQIWAEAVHLQRSGVNWWSVPVEQAEAEASARVPVDTWQEVLENALDDRRAYTMAQIMGEILKIEVRDQDRRNQLRVADIIRTLGFESQSRRDASGRVYRTWATSVTE